MGRGTRVKSPCVCVGLGHRDQQNDSLFDISEWDRSDVPSME